MLTIPSAQLFNIRYVLFSTTCFDPDGGDMTTGRYIPEDRTPHNHRCENLESYSSLLSWHICILLHLRCCSYNHIWMCGQFG
jgi:hypothetical protein